jgi:hypothetical protein
LPAGTNGKQDSGVMLMLVLITHRQHLIVMRAVEVNKPLLDSVANDRGQRAFQPVI